MKIANIVPTLQGVSFNWSDGAQSLFDLDDAMPESMVYACAKLGLATKLQNAYAGGASKGWSFAQCREAAEALYARICAGEWEQRANGGIWVEAIARAMLQSIEDAAAAWAKLDDKQKAKVRKHPKVADAKLAIERERINFDDEDAPDLDDLMSIE